MTFGSTLVTNPNGGFLVRKQRVATASEPGMPSLPVFIVSTVYFLILWFLFIYFYKACGPLYAYRCGHLHYTTGICSDVSPAFQVVNSIAPVQGRGFVQGFFLRKVPAMNEAGACTEHAKKLALFSQLPV